MPSNPRHYLSGFVATLLLAAAGFFAFVIVVDPYWEFDLADIKGLNVIKPEFTNQLRLGKANQVCRQRPANVILGSSREEMGVDPEHPAFAAFPGRTYNLAMSGSGLWELNETLQHAYWGSGRRLKLAVVGLGFFMFNAYREAVVFGTEVIDFDKERLVLSADESCWHTFFHDIDSFLGAGAAAAAWNTVEAQHYPDGHDYFLHDGMRDQVANFDAIYYAAGNDYRSGFSGQERYYLQRIWRAGPEHRYCFDADGRASVFATFADMIDFAYRHGIELRFFMDPLHSRMLYAIGQAGLWPQFEDWQRGLVRVLHEEAAKHHATPFPLWDFSGFNSITDEAIPPAGDKTPMRWYWEGSHYKKATGDLILDRVLGRQSSDLAAHPDFGVQLTPSNVEDVVLAARTGFLHYAAAFPQDAQFADHIVADVMQDDGSDCGHDIEEVRRGATALAAGDKRAAAAHFAQAERIHQDEKARFAALGVPYREDEGFRPLLARAEAGEKLRPLLATWQDYQNRGMKLVAAGELAPAVDDFTTAIRYGPADTALYFLRGTTLLRLLDYDRAIGDFKAGLQLDPANPTLASLLKQAEAGRVAKRAAFHPPAGAGAPAALQHQ